MSLSGNVHVEVAFGKKWADTITPNGADLDGTGDYTSTSDSAALSVVGDLEVRAHITPDAWVPTPNMDIASHFAASPELGWVFLLRNDGKLQLFWSEDGLSWIASPTSSVATGLSGTAWVAATLDVDGGTGGDGLLTFYTYAGAHDAPAALSDWTQLGTAQEGGSAPTSINDSSSSVEFGNTNNPWFGQLHELRVYDGLQANGGTLVANPRYSDVSQWQIGATTTGTDAQGNIWTLQADAVIIGSWVNVSTDATSVTYRRGRLYESDDYEAGTARIVLNNEDRAYEPGFSSGANYPNVVPWVPVRIRIEYGGHSTIVWQGFVDSWDLSFPQAGQHTFCTMSATDVFRLFNRLSIRAYEQEVSTDNPIGWWKLQETTGTTATDSGSLGVDGTYTNTPTLGQTGPIAGMLAVDLEDQASEHVSIGTFTGSDVGADFTVECWFNLDSGDASVIQGLLQIDTDAGDSLAVFTNTVDSVRRVGFQAPRATSGWQGATAFDLSYSADTWVHCAMAVDYSAKRVTPYLDGVQGTQLVLDQWDQTRTTGTMTVLISQVGGLLWFDGLVSQVAIYDSVLTAGRIAAHAKAAAHTFAAETYDTRISNILTDIGWGGGSDLRAGQSTLTALTDTDSSVLAALRRAARSEDGEVYVGRDGRIVGKDRHARRGITTSNFTFEKNFQEILPSMDDTLIFNEAKITTAASKIARAFDAGSQTSYGPREITLSNVDIGVDDAANMASMIVGRYKDEQLRSERIAFNPETNAATLWPEVRDRDIGDRITLTAEPQPKTGNPISTEMFIEQIQGVFTPGTAEVRLRCSPADKQMVWILDVSKLNQSTLVGY